jgi:membrane fusion protein, multidrug efflux system
MMFSFPLTKSRQPRLPILVVASLLLLALGGCGEKPKAAGRAGAQAAPVLVGKAQRKVVPLALDAIGAVEPTRTAGVRSQVTGILLKIEFQEGQDVKQGDLMFEIDPRPFQSALRSAMADLQKAKAQLETAEAEVTRYDALVQQNMVSREQFQTIQTSERTLRASLASSEAAVESDQLMLEFCSIRAPISGKTGNLGAHEGDLVRASDAGTALITINQLSPIYVTFSVPQENLGALNQYRAAGELAVNAAPPGTTEITEKGALTFIDNAIDSTTGTVKLKATFPNQDHRLWPGQFVNVRTVLTAPEVLVVPAVAIQNDQTGQHVFVVKSDQTAEFRTVTVERTVEADAIITKGLKEGETVVVDGQLRVLPGKPVAVKNGGVDATKSAESPAGKENGPDKAKEKTT